MIIDDLPVSIHWRNFKKEYWHNMQGNWEYYINGILDGIAIYNWDEGTVTFNSEEDYINFVLRWS